MVPFSVLDLCPITEGGTPADSFRNSLDLAQHAERWGYHRFWLAEHHNIPGIASAATSIVIAHVAAGTKTIRVGSGGIMLPNHSPLTIAEQFGTLASLFPDRIDLGLGRAPGADMQTARALRRENLNAADQFPQDVQELQQYFADPEPDQAIRAVPGACLRVPIWLLGSSLFSAQLAAHLGLPFAFAAHFAPADLVPALAMYRKGFRPSEQLQHPYAAVCLNVIAADTDAEARYLFSSIQQAFLALRRGTPGKLKPPLENFDLLTGPADQALLDQVLSQAIVGSPKTVSDRLQQFLDTHHPDELIVTANIYDHRARLHSFELVARVANTAQ
ncbi:MAG: LLM class flavin-dependent oxidoreductase [Bryobacteraceae bacterium]